MNYKQYVDILRIINEAIENAEWHQHYGGFSGHLYGAIVKLREIRAEVNKIAGVDIVDQYKIAVKLKELDDAYQYGQLQE
jgi:hypothetical protein